MAQTNDEKKDVTEPQAQAPQEAQAPAAAPAPAPAPGRDSRRGGFGRGGQGQGRGRRRPGGRGKFQQEEKEFIEKVVAIKRVAKVVKGGRRFSFNALVVAGDGKGKAGIGFGKAKEISEAIRKGLNDAKKNFFAVPLVGTTIPHEMIGHFKAAKVLLKPASPGTGVIAGGAVRALCEAGGIKDILTKSLGSDTAMNVLKAAETGLKQMRRERAVFTTGEAKSETE